MATTALRPQPSRYRSGLYEWLTTTDHKKIGILYLINSLVFFFVGGHPGPARPVRAGRSRACSSSTTDVYNQLFTMHASFMLFLFVIPILAGFGNYVVPLHDRRAGHGVPADQRAVVLAAARSPACSWPRASWSPVARPRPAGPATRRCRSSAQYAARARTSGSWR